MAWFTPEHRVLVAAIRQAAATGLGTHAWQLSWILGEFLDLQGNWHEAALIHEAAIDAAQRTGDRAGAAYCHRSLGRTYRRLDRHDKAYTHLRRALKLLDELGDRDGQAHSHLGLSVVLDEQGRHPEALDHARQALELFRATDHRAGQATALNTVGWFHAQLGEYRQALTECQQALTLHHELGNLREEAATWDSIGYACQHLGQHVEAVASYQHAVQMFRDLSDRYNEAEILSRLGDTHHAAGNTTAARHAWQQALTILTDLEHPTPTTSGRNFTNLTRPSPKIDAATANPDGFLDRVVADRSRRLREWASACNSIDIGRGSLTTATQSPIPTRFSHLNARRHPLMLQPLPSAQDSSGRRLGVRARHGRRLQRVRRSCVRPRS